MKIPVSRQRGEASITHGATRGHRTGTKPNRTYDTWCRIKGRCYNLTDPRYPLYGGRGLTVCARWINSFPNFLADMGERPGKVSIDRIDNSLGYSPENCRWADQKTQCNNKRGNHLLTHAGLTLTMQQWSEKTGIGYSTLRSRINDYGWSIARALTPGRKPRIRRSA